MEEEDQPAEPARLERSLPSNPYDFSGPAGDGVFAGRRGEQQRLDEFAASLADGRPRHLLIHGRRGIGKTSLIGRLDEIASKQRVLVASVCLDEGGVLETPFLVACVVSLASAAVELGAFGGPSGPFPSALEDALIGAVVDPTLGPLRAARFSGIQSNNERIPDALITRDLHDIRDAAAEVGIRGIVLVVDEADYLSASPSAAQRLRNLFITHGQVSTILVGTEAGQRFIVRIAVSSGDAHWARQVSDRPVVKIFGAEADEATV